MSALPCTAIIPDTNTYPCQRSSTCTESPSFVVLPRSSSEVSLVLKVINALRLTFAVRSGGHSPNPGWSSTQQPGLVIDLRSLNQISVTDDKVIVTLGPGALWGDVYETLDKHEITVTGGRIPSVGVGGLILGGEGFPIERVACWVYLLISCYRRLLAFFRRVWTYGGYCEEL